MSIDIPASVLIVDDDDEIRTSLRFLLEGEGYQVEAVHDGEAALTLLCASHARQVVLVDHLMPQLDGIGLLNAIAEDRRLLRHGYILMSAEPAALCHALNSLRLPLPVPVLFKPFDVSSLLDIVGRVARRLSMARATGSMLSAR